VKKRLFIAVDISDEARKRVREYIEVLKANARETRVSWTKPENLHLTLKFLGDVDQSRIVLLTTALEQIVKALSPIDLEISGTGVFPSTGKPKVLWIGVDDVSGDLAKAAQSIEEACDKLGFAREDRKFSPHLTIGRVREPSHARELAEQHLENGFASIQFPVSEIVLYESKLSPAGSIYTPLVKAKLQR
jgi:2'-5' RNA ligase